MSQGAWYVRYHIDGFAGEHEAGPYLTLEIAHKHRDDIAGYEGITEAAIEWREPIELNAAS
jgi:hypothetical protein